MQWAKLMCMEWKHLWTCLVQCPWEPRVENICTEPKNMCMGARCMSMGAKYMCTKPPKMCIEVKNICTEANKIVWELPCTCIFMKYNVKMYNCHSQTEPQPNLTCVRSDTELVGTTHPTIPHTTHTNFWGTFRQPGVQHYFIPNEHNWLWHNCKLTKSSPKLANKGKDILLCINTNDDKWYGYISAFLLQLLITALFKHGLHHMWFVLHMYPH